MTYDRAAREAYLDGYRTGLGAAVRAIDGIRHACGDDGAITAILSGLASGLRLCSASAVLAQEDDETGAPTQGHQTHPESGSDAQ